jgi:hypothetical protein
MDTSFEENEYIYKLTHTAGLLIERTVLTKLLPVRLDWEVFSFLRTVATVPSFLKYLQAMNKLCYSLEKSFISHYIGGYASAWMD